MTASGLGVLTTHANSPVVTKTPMQSDTLHALDVLGEKLGECLLYR